MATPQQGIMALPETDEAQAPTLSLLEANDAAKQGLKDANPEYAAMYDQAMAQIMPALMALSDQELDVLMQLIQYLQDHPEEYAQRVQELESDGTLEKDSLPPEYDENFLTTFIAAIVEAQRTNEDTGQGSAQMQPPMQLAKGGIAEAARMVAKQGRTGDTMLAHINKDEAKLLRKHGGVGTINPRTGLPEYGFFSGITSALKSVGKAVSGAVKSVGSGIKSVLSSPLGRIVATVALAAFIGPAAFGLTGAAGMAAQFGLASAGVTALGGGNLKDVVRAGVTGAVTGYGGAALGPALGGATGVTSAAGQAALGAGATSTGMGLVQGKSVKDSVKEGLTAAALAGTMAAANDTGLSRGTGTQDPSKVPVDDRSILSPEAAKAAATAPATNPQPLASSDAAFNQAMANSGTPPANTGFKADYNLAPSAPTGGAGTGINTAGMPSAPVPPTGGIGNLPTTTAALPGGQGAVPPAAEPSWFSKTFSPSTIQQQGNVDALSAVQKQYPGLTQEQIAMAPAGSPVAQAYKAAQPGMLATYGPATGLTLAGVAALGGFKQNQPNGPEQEMQEKLSGTPGQDLIKANPKEYIPQGVTGVTYDSKGNVVTSGQRWNPYVPQNTEYAPTNYIPYTPTRYLADGGFAGSAFPQSPLSMDQGPMMAHMASPVSMNTPGVPMNVPMQYAVGGIASLAVGGYPRRTGQISGPGTEKSDSIPAMLSDGEFVMTAKAVRGAGKGSRMAGAKKMYALMHKLEKNAARG